MPDFAKPLARLITDFKRLPGIGRFTSYAPRATTPNSSPKPCWMSTTSWASAVSATTSATAICASSAAILTAILGIEVTRQFNGLYRVLHGALSPLKGIGPERPWKAAGRGRAGKLDFSSMRPAWKPKRGSFASGYNVRLGDRHRATPSPGCGSVPTKITTGGGSCSFSYSYY